MEAAFENVSDDTINDIINDTIKLAETELTILNQIKADCHITREMIVANTGLSDSTVARGLNSLQEKSIIRRKGARKKWILGVCREQN